jgi:predicted nucleotide-binding protein
MPRKSSSRPDLPKSNRIFGSIEDVERSKRKIEKRLVEVKRLLELYPNIPKDKLHALQDKAKDTFRDVYGADSAEFERLQFFSLHELLVVSGKMPAQWYQDKYKAGLERAIVTVETLIEALDERKEEIEENDARPFWEEQSTDLVKGRRTKEVFIMHGHDEVNLRALEKMIRDDFSLVPVIMKDMPADGLEHFLTKFERVAESCSYAVALFTKDDFIKKGDSEIWQGRPNVIFELGWFCHRWKRKNITLLVQNGTFMPSDLQGIEEYRFELAVKEIYQDIHRILKKAQLAN